jgi:hypothetical protein
VLLRHVPLPDLILAAGIAGMAVFVLLAEFRPRRNRSDDDDQEPEPAVAGPSMSGHLCYSMQVASRRRRLT